MKEVIAARLDDLIALAQQLKATVEAEQPGAMPPTFPLMRLGLDADAMVNTLQAHLERLIPQPEGNRGKSTA
ncbi:MAG TPA: hypothetical protein DDY78_06235 [Planctomycetales bacterium]|jgi:hypothetical protein|nr:hypothetical protein [Planctomycetales bacterium]